MTAYGGNASILGAPGGAGQFTGGAASAAETEAPVTGDTLARLSGLPQLRVAAPDQAAIYVDEDGNATSPTGDASTTIILLKSCEAASAEMARSVPCMASPGVSLSAWRAHS